MSLSAVHVSLMTKSSMSCKNTCSHFYGLFNKTAEQSMKTASFSALSLSLSCCLSAIILQVLASCFAFVCVHIFCAPLSISGGLFRNMVACRRGRRASVDRYGCLGWVNGGYDCQLHHGMCLKLTITAHLRDLSGERHSVWDYLV